jgi:hypothetical protein
MFITDTIFRREVLLLQIHCKFQSFHGVFILPYILAFSAMLHDDQVFSNPSNFIPERFLKDGSLNPDLPDPQVIATFGFGRR